MKSNDLDPRPRNLQACRRQLEASERAMSAALAELREARERIKALESELAYLLDPWAWEWPQEYVEKLKKLLGGDDDQA